MQANQGIPKVVVIEDEQSIQQMYQLKLERSGYHVKVASDGEEGLKIVESFRPDIILLDLNMPRMRGETMLEGLRSKDWGKNIKVIILTNISRDEAPSILRFLNVDRYVVKAHYTPTQVIEIVREVMGSDYPEAQIA